MPEVSTLAVFATAALALLVVPGPAVLYVVSRSVDQGRVAGLVSVLGLHAGTVVHTGAAALRISALVVHSAAAFYTFKYLGAAYLILLGIRRMAAGEPTNEIDTRRSSLWSVFSQGVVVNVLNPKTALFFFAFISQFVDGSCGVVWLQVVVLGTVFISLGLLSDGAYAFLASAVGTRLRAGRAFARFRRYFAGGFLLTLGVAAALSGPRSASR